MKSSESSVTFLDDELWEHPNSTENSQRFYARFPPGSLKKPDRKLDQSHRMFLHEGFIELS